MVKANKKKTDTARKKKIVKAKELLMYLYFIFYNSIVDH